MVAYSFKRRFVDPIRVGLSSVALSFDCQPKRQTIRAIGKRRHARPGEIIQLYHGMRTKQCFSIGIARCTSVEGVLLKWSEWPAFRTFDVIELNGRTKRHGPTSPIVDMEAFAISDGFASLDEMKKFWSEEHGLSTFEGLLIKWEPIR